MQTTKICIGNIPALLWGAEAETLVLYVHGRYSQKEYAENIASAANNSGFQLLSFDLPQHGERMDEPYECTPQHAEHDLNLVLQYARQKSQSIILVAVSLGVYFSLLSYHDEVFQQALFISPITDMLALLNIRMKAVGADEKQLKDAQVISFPEGNDDPLDYEYYQYVKKHPPKVWKTETSIFSGALDELQSLAVTEKFSQKFGCTVTTLAQGSHALMTDSEQQALLKWVTQEFSQVN